MANKIRKNWDSRVISAYSKFLSKAANAVSSLLGLWFIACFIGWKRANSYYSELGAEWLSSNLNLIQILELSAWPIIAFLSGILVTFTDFAERENAKGMHLIGMILSIVALALVSIEFYIEVWIKDYAAAITITNSCLYVAAGIFGYVLGNIILDTEKRRKNLKGSHLWGLCFYCFWYINFVGMLGKLEGKRDSDINQSRLASVVLKDQAHLHLILERDGRLYTAKLNPDSNTEIRIFDYKDIEYIYNQKKSHMSNSAEDGK